MAGDWIKIEIATSQKIEVFQLAEILDLDVDTVLGKLMRLWCWADVNTINGHARSVTKKLLDRVVDCDGFATALLDDRVAWLEEGENGDLLFPNFDRHNGKGAKKRATDAERQANKRAKDADETVSKSSRSQRDKSVTREEKRREDLKDKTPHNARENFSTPSPKAANAIIDNHVPPSAGEMVDGKFTMFEGWQPSADFQRKAALWGVILDKPLAPEEIAEFITYWNAEGKAFHQAQWEQKLARSVQMQRNRKAAGDKNHAESRPNPRDPNFRGYAAEAVHAANAELRRQYGIDDEESDAFLGPNGGDVFGQVVSEKRGETVITLDQRDWEAD